MKYLGMTIHCIGIVLFGIWLCSTLFDVNLQDIDNVNRTNIKLDRLEKKEINTR